MVDVFGSRAQDISRDFGFRQAVATRDQATIESALANLIARLDNDSAFVIDLDDELMAITGSDVIADDAVMLPDGLKEAAQADGYAARFVAVDGEIFEIVIAPVEAPVTIGWVGLAVRLDQEVASELKELSPIQLELAFTYESGSEHRLATATADEARMRGFVESWQGQEVASRI